MSPTPSSGCPPFGNGPRPGRAQALALALALVGVLSLLAASGRAQAQAQAQAPPKAEAFLVSGRLAEGEKALAEALKAEPGDDQTRFGLGVVQFLRAVEARIQGFYTYGFRTDAGNGLGVLTNLPVPVNPRPEPIDGKTLRALLRGWVDDLGRAEATLSGVTSPGVKLPLHFAQIRLDFDADGTAGESESLWRVYTRFNRTAGAVPPGGADGAGAGAAETGQEEAARGFVIAFDRGDVDWLRGYCHLLSAVAEVILAHDFDDLFAHTGYLFFRGAKVPFAFMAEEEAAGRAGGLEFGRISDAVALIHRLNLPVSEPARMASALQHLGATEALSRSSWKAILAETDDDREWIPGPKQATVVPGVRVTDEMVQGWFDFLDEFHAILAGEKLLPFWRGTDKTRGLNLRRVFTEPKPFDLVLWVEGAAAAPYLEKGPVTRPETWQRLSRVFRGEFIGFAIWFN